MTQTIFFITCLLFACNTIPNKLQNPVPVITTFPVVTIDGCEYLQQPTGMGGFVYIHKGNCKASLHYFKDNNTFKYIVDLESNSQIISTDYLHPDSLIGYVSHDTLHLIILKNKKE